MNLKEKKLECVIYILDSRDLVFVDDLGCCCLGVLIIFFFDLLDGVVIEFEESMIFGEIEFWF